MTCQLGCRGRRQASPAISRMTPLAGMFTSRGLDGHFTRDYVRNIGAEIMGRNTAPGTITTPESKYW